MAAYPGTIFVFNVARRRRRAKNGTIIFEIRLTEPKKKNKKKTTSVLCIGTHGESETSFNTVVHKNVEVQCTPANSQPKISKLYIFTCLGHETYKLGRYYLK